MSQDQNQEAEIKEYPNKTTKQQLEQSVLKANKTKQQDGKIQKVMSVAQSGCKTGLTTPNKKDLPQKTEQNTIEEKGKQTEPND